MAIRRLCHLSGRGDDVSIHVPRDRGSRVGGVRGAGQPQFVHAIRDNVDVTGYVRETRSS